LDCRNSIRLGPTLGAVVALAGAASLAASATDLPKAADPVPPPAAAAAPAVLPRPLDLRLPNPRRFIPPEQLNEPWTEELDEVLIRPRRQPPDLPERRAVPQGLAGLFWAARRPTQAWRLLVPDPNAPGIPLRSPDDPKEPPGAFRSRIGEPGKIF
jgi:hypothetical protein